MGDQDQECHQARHQEGQQVAARVQRVKRRKADQNHKRELMKEREDSAKTAAKHLVLVPRRGRTHFRQMLQQRNLSEGCGLQGMD